MKTIHQLDAHNKIGWFTKSETLGLSVLFGLFLFISLLNFKDSFRKSRDNQRKSDIRAIYNAISSFQGDFSLVPASFNGKIVACNPEFKEEILTLSPCNWGVDSILDPSFKDFVYINLPIDPQNPHISYYYLSNGRQFQILASLEGKDEDEYREDIEARKLPCGLRNCNYGLASGELPLDKSFQEYENELENRLKQ
mgnify:CR=1 FL=1